MSSIFVSIDIETTGLDKEKCQIIEIGAQINDWLLPIDKPPEFHCYVVQEVYTGEPYALAMHAEIFRRIAAREEGYNYYYPHEVPHILGAWMKTNGAYVSDYPDAEPRAVICGKNFGMFDDRFLRQLKNFDKHVKYIHRVIDPAMLYWEPFIDTKPPSTKLCMERAGLTGEVPHTALEDARIVSKLVHIAVGRKVSPRQLLEEHVRRCRDSVRNSTQKGK